MKSRKPKKPEYPQETRGSKLASEIRQRANSLNDAEREDLFKEGMQIIYGGTAKASLARH